MKKHQKIDYSVFIGTSSVEEATIKFALGHYTFSEWERECWPKECKVTIRQIKHRGYKKVRRSIREAYNRDGGFDDWCDLKDWYSCECY